jgi:hypothetical protein
VDQREVQERAADAQDLLQTRIFLESVIALRKQYFDELMAIPPGDLRATGVHAKLQALEAIPQQLAIFIGDAKMVTRRK